jgi:hypothetical protein
MGQKEVTIETVQTAGGCHLKVIHVFLLAGHCKCCAAGKKSCQMMAVLTESKNKGKPLSKSLPLLKKRYHTVFYALILTFLKR